MVSVVGGIKMKVRWFNELTRLALVAFAVFAPMKVGAAETNHEISDSVLLSSVWAEDVLLDVDGDGDSAALTDGILILRRLFGFEGEVLVNGALGNNSLATASEISERIDSRESFFDIDQDGKTLPLTDGLLILRYLFDFRGEALTAGVVNSGNSLTDSEIENNLRLLAGDEDSTVSLSILYERYFPAVVEGARFDTVMLDYESSEFQPARFVEVRVFDSASLPQLNAIATLQTDSEGKVAFDIPTHSEVFIEITSTSSINSAAGGWTLRVNDNQGRLARVSDDVYSVRIPSFRVDGDKVLEHKILGGWTGNDYSEPRLSAPFAILDSIIEAMTSILNASPGLEFPPLVVNWSTLNSTNAIGSSYYQDSMIYVLGRADEDTDEFDSHVIIHEWGHFFQDAMSRDDSIGGPHWFNDILDPRVAFSEGWANAFAGLVLGDPIYKDTNGLEQSGGFYISMETMSPTVTRGWFSEDSVASIVNDLFDFESDFEDQDNLALGMAAMVATLIEDLPSDSSASTVFSFIASIINRSPHKADSINAIVQAQGLTSEIGDFDSLGSGEKDVAAGISSNALPIYVEIVQTGSDTRVCQDKVHTRASLDGDLWNANKLANRSLGRLTIAEMGNYRITAKSGVSEDGTGASRDPDLYLYRTGRLVAADEQAGPVDLSFAVDEPGEYWFELYDYKFLNTIGGEEACQLLRLESI